MILSYLYDLGTSRAVPKNTPANRKPAKADAQTLPANRKRAG